eukprot:TRINITY_DN2006_c0_g1_i1.p1 TRINITY_DN2006_c0_g1~~TRINITY_DN2006_c0_g1_i1.p1  ORF type:complete len:163 (+),score=44.61 TRINITY_DN2006_c0_g1_i1:50-490(+)
MVGTIEELDDAAPDTEYGKKIVSNNGGEKESGAKKQYRGMFEAHFIDFVMYVVAFCAGAGCLYLGLYSPNASVYRMMKMKVPQVPLTHEKMLKFGAWWAFSAGLVGFGALAMFISFIGFLIASLRSFNNLFRSAAVWLASKKEKVE